MSAANFIIEWTPHTSREQSFEDWKQRVPRVRGPSRINTSPRRMIALSGKMIAQLLLRVWQTARKMLRVLFSSTSSTPVVQICSECDMPSTIGTK